jgi:hypothetical protein
VRLSPLRVVGAQLGAPARGARPAQQRPDLAARTPLPARGAAAAQPDTQQQQKHRAHEARSAAALPPRLLQLLPTSSKSALAVRPTPEGSAAARRR